jgi:GNAT superfamily N-acetyltransferase
MRQFLRHAAQRIREHGLGKLLARQLARAARRLAAAIYQERVEVILTKEVADPIPDDVVIPFSFDNLAAADVAPLRRFILEHNVDPTTALRRLEVSLARGYRGLLARADGQIVGYGWYTGVTAVHPQMRLHGLDLQEDEVFTFDLFLAPFIRNRHAGLAFLVAGQRYMRARGVRRACNTVLASNRRSLWVHHQAGWKEVERHTVRILMSAVLICRHRMQRHDRRWF